jgi:outer membrane protein assembly factor BamB
LQSDLARRHAADAPCAMLLQEDDAMQGTINPVFGRVCPTFAALLAALLIAWASAGGATAQGNDQYPLRGPDELSPPSVQPPIYKCARAVSVYGFRPGATVDVYAKGMEHLGRISAPDTYGAIPLDVKVSRPLNVCDVISATQTYNGITSKQSFYPVVVVDDPAITTPVVDPDLWECGQIVNVHNLRPSTHVEVLDLDASPMGTVIGTGESTSENLAVVTSKLVVRHHVAAVQIFCPGMPTETRSPQSAAQVVVPMAPRPPNVPTLDAPVPGSHRVYLHQLLVGSYIEVKNGAAVIVSGLANAHDNYWPTVNPLPSGLPVGQPTATQALCDASPPGHSPPEATSLPTPTLGWPICEGSHYVTVWNTKPAAAIILVRGGGQIGSGSGSMATVGGGITLAPGDDLMVVQQDGSLTSPPSNHVIVGCASNGNVVTQHNDNNRSGVYPYETTLTASQVLARGMVIKYRHPVDGSINAQPLYVRRVAFQSGGANGLFVATIFGRDYTVYGLDADTGAEKWRTHLIDSDPGKRRIARGVDSTPVIDVASQKMYVLFSTKNQDKDESDAPDSTHPINHGKPHVYEDELTNLDVAYWLVALDYRTGSELGRTQVTASLFRADGSTVSFLGKNQRNHAALLLDHGSVYVAFCERGESFTNYHGWVMRYRATDLAFQGAFCTSKNFRSPTSPPFMSNDPVDGAGIWQGGGGLASDPDGNVYFLAGNGTADLSNDKYGDCFIKLMPTAGGLIPTAFVPSGAVQLQQNDVDLGAGGALTIPGSNLVIGGGKTGYMYLLDRNTMQLVQQITASTNQYDNTQRDQTWDKGPHLHGSPTYWRGPDQIYGNLYVWGEKDFLRHYRFNTITGKFDEPAAHPGSVLALRDSMPGGMASLSANGNTAGTGIIWATLPESDVTPPWQGHLYAFDAETLKPLWDSSFPLSPNGFPESLGHWLPPTIADGTVFIGTSSNELIAYTLGLESGRDRHHGKPFQPRATSRTPLGKRYRDEASVLTLPRIVLSLLAPPRGVVKGAVLEGDGERIYEAKETGAEGGGLVWELRGSSARLLVVRPSEPGGEREQTHVQLSPDGTWSASDGSNALSVVEKTVPALETADAPWLLFRVSRAEGRGILGSVSYIQCISTRGGAPPRKRPLRRGATTRVRYHARYILYR